MKPEKNKAFKEQTQFTGRTFIRTKGEEPEYPDRIQEYVLHDDGYYQLITFADIESYFRKLAETENFRIIDHNDLSCLSAKDRARIEMLIALESTNCGHCGTFLNNKTFTDICMIYEDYLDRLIEEILRHSGPN